MLCVELLLYRSGCHC